MNNKIKVQFQTEIKSQNKIKKTIKVVRYRKYYTAENLFLRIMKLNKLEKTKQIKVTLKYK
jgi:hypothetical protein